MLSGAVAGHNACADNVAAACAGDAVVARFAEPLRVVALVAGLHHHHRVCGHHIMGVRSNLRPLTRACAHLRGRFGAWRGALTSQDCGTAHGRRGREHIGGGGSWCTIVQVARMLSQTLGLHTQSLLGVQVRPAATSVVGPAMGWGGECYRGLWEQIKVALFPRRPPVPS